MWRRIYLNWSISRQTLFASRASLSSDFFFIVEWDEKYETVILVAPGDLLECQLNIRLYSQFDLHWCNTQTSKTRYHLRGESGGSHWKGASATHDRRGVYDTPPPWQASLLVDTQTAVCIQWGRLNAQCDVLGQVTPCIITVHSCAIRTLTDTSARKTRDLVCM